VRSTLRPRKACNWSVQCNGWRANIVVLYSRSFGCDLWWTAVLFGYINQVAKKATPILVMPSLYLHSRSELSNRNSVLCVLSRGPLFEVQRYDVRKLALRITHLRAWVTGKLLRIRRSNNRNEYQEYFLGGKGGRYVGLTTLIPSCAVLKSDSINLMETSGPVLACNGVAFYLLTFYHIINMFQFPKNNPRGVRFIHFSSKINKMNHQM